MFSLHDTWVDGVRCFWVDTGRPTLAAQLVFRQGMADEWLTESGWLHMLEHLALHGSGGGGLLSTNGSVSLLHTEFTAHGPADLVGHHLAKLSSWLANPSFHEFERERGVLEAESRLRSDSPARRALGWRYGSIGPGTAAYGDPGIHRSTPEALHARARWAFGSGNAVLVLDGPPPPGLRLHLAPGDLRTPPRAVPCGDTLPAAYVEEGGLVVSGVIDRSAAATFVPTLIERSLRTRLRDQAGAAYAPWATYEPVDDTQALVIAGSDVLPSALSTLLDTALSAIRDLAVLGPTPEDLEALRQERHQAMHDPYAAAALALRSAHAYLRSDSPRSFTELVDELLSITDKEVKAEARRFHESLMVGVPSGTGWDGQIPRLAFPRGPRRVQGRGYRHRDWPAEPTRLVIGSTGVELRSPDGARSIPFEDARAVFGFADGSHRVISHEGWPIEVVATEWSGGGHAVDELRRLTPPELHVPLGSGSQQPRGPGLGPIRRWAMWARRVVGGRFGRPVWSMLLITLVLVAGVSMAVSAAGGIRLPAVLLTLLIGAALGISSQRNRV